MVQNNENSKDGKIMESTKTIESKISKNHEKLTANNITNNSVEIAKQGLICKYYSSIYSCCSKIRKKVQINKG